MKFATAKSTDKDGSLLLVSNDLEYAIPTTDIAPTLQSALENWSTCKHLLEERYFLLNKGLLSGISPLQSFKLMAPLPRTWQWLDGSCFLNHGALMQKAFNLEPIDDVDKYPLIYQGAGDNFSSPTDDIIVPDEAFGTDFEGEFGVIIDKVPMGSSRKCAQDAIRLIVLLNDISYRALAPREMKTGFGFLQAKGATAFAPIAVTPDELGNAWTDSRVHLQLNVQRNDIEFGTPNGSEMHFGFDQLIAHAAHTRTLLPGTLLGSGTVSNSEPSVGHACIAEARAKEMIMNGKSESQYLCDGELITMQAVNRFGFSVFGQISQRVVVENNYV